MNDLSTKPHTSGDVTDRIAALSPAKQALLELRLKKSRSSALAGQTIVRRSDRESAPPLSFAQQRLWFLDQLEPNSALYNISTALRLRGRLNTEALQKSLAVIVERHEVLRTTFASVNGDPVQVINENPGVALAMVDLSAWPKGDRELQVKRLRKQEARRPFNLSSDLMLRSTLIRLSEEENVLQLVMHHIASDGWSIGVLLRELDVLYDAFCNEKPSPLPELSIQYADYAIWQQQWLQGEVLQKQLSYWKKQLNGTSTLRLPTDRPRPAVQTHRGASQSLMLSKELTESLNALSLKEKASLFMTLLAAFQLLLHRFTGQDDIAVGSPIAGRNRAETEGLIGFFINTLVLRTVFSDNPTFKEVLARVRGTCLDAYAHQDVPFEKLVEELRPERDLSRTPLFQVFMNMVNIAKRVVPEGFKTESSSVTGSAYSRTDESTSDFEAQSKFDLTIYVRERDGALNFNWVYNADLFDRNRIQEMSRQYETLLSQVAEHPDASIDSYSLLTATGQELLPNPVEPLGSDWVGSVHEGFLWQARSSPAHPAITDPSGSWTYAELNSRTNQLAHYLLRNGIQREDIIAVYAHRSASLVWALLGILKAGAAFLILDPAYPAARLIQYIRMAKPRGVIELQAAGVVSNELESVLRASVDFCVTLPVSAGLGADKVFEGYSTADPEMEIHPDDLAYISYTSGSTGEPNGILGTHGPLSHFVRWQTENFALTGSDRFSFLSGLSHDPALRDIFTPLCTGGTLCILDPQQFGSPGYLRRWMKREEITIAHLAPTMIELLNESGSEADGRSANGAVPLLRYAFFGGDSLTQRDLSKFQKIFPLTTCVNFYGATETPQAMGYFVIPQKGDTGRAGEIRTEKIPLGRGIEGAQLLVLNDAEQLAGIGELGEICVRTPYLARGYLCNDALTQQRFVANPFNKIPGDRLYKTGDMGRYLPDGNVEYIGRADHQVKIRGFRIELGEIETVLCQNPAVRQSVVLARDEIPGDKRLVAYVVSTQGESLVTNDLRDFLKKKLPDYMVPSAFVVVENLPLTPNGKVDRKTLPAPDYTREQQEKKLLAPRDELELQLTKIWEKVLKVRPIGVRDNFFELGGHSLLAVRLFAQIEKTMRKNLPVAALFHAPTIEQLARLISEDGWSAQWKSLVAIQPGGSRPPLFCVHAHDGGVLFWRDLARHLGPDQPFYGFQPQGLDGQQPLHHRIAEMAGHYIKEMRTMQPEGPYFIGGHCIGGLMAFEMAQQLHAQGENVALLALFDSFAPRRGKRARSSLLRRYRYRAICVFERTVSLHIGNLSVVAPRKRLPYIRDKFNKALYKLYMGLGSAWVPAARARRSILKAASQAARKYNPKTYPGKITLFRATDLGGGIRHDHDMGWRPLAGAGVETHLIPGYHAHIVLEPRVRLLAKELTAVLARAQECKESGPIVRAVQSNSTQVLERQD
jgi:amino acid adenylation domain-containing protein